MVPLERAVVRYIAPAPAYLAGASQAAHVGPLKLPQSAFREHHGRTMKSVAVLYVRG
jgi:hypothetical protein